MYSDTPQGGINGIVGGEDDPSLGSNAFLTNARHKFGDTEGSLGTMTYGKTNNSNGTTNYGRITDETGKLNSVGKSVGDIDYSEHVSGYRGKSPSKSLEEFRKTMLNIDMQVIKDLEDLFFQLW